MAHETISHAELAILVVFPVHGHYRDRVVLDGWGTESRAL